jgi:hypothetical protein
MDRDSLANMWDETHNKYSWFPAFNASFKDLSPQQAAFKPSPQRHSIWQILNHICFWRETVVGRERGKKPSDEEMTRRNFEEPADVSPDAWRGAVERFEKSQRLIHEAMTDEKFPAEKLQYILPHDAYHLGQVMYLRAMQGLPPVE